MYVHEFYHRILLTAQQWPYFYCWVSLVIKLGWVQTWDRVWLGTFINRPTSESKDICLIQTKSSVCNIFVCILLTSWVFFFQFYRQCFEELGTFDVKGWGDCCRTNNDKCDWIGFEEPLFLQTESDLIKQKRRSVFTSHHTRPSAITALTRLSRTRLKRGGNI